MLRVVLSAWVTKTTAAEILANPATRRRQVTMTISLNPLRSPCSPGKPARFPGRQKPSQFPPHEIGHARDKRERNRSLPEASASSAYFVNGQPLLAAVG